MPLLLCTYDNQSMRDILAEELRETHYDCIHIEPFYVYPSLPEYTVPLVVTEHNVEYEVYLKYADRFPIPIFRPFLRADIRKLKIWEERVWKKADALIAVSDDDAKKISLTAPNVPVTVVPNGVDMSSYPFKNTAITEKSLTCLFVGDFTWFPNRDAVQMLIRDIWPGIHKTFSQATLRIAGRNMPDWLKDDTELSITAAGEVSDVRKEFERADILLAPMTIGGGTKFKILEALASGTIVVTSKEGIAGLPVTNGKEVMIAETKREYCDAVTKVISDETFAPKLRMSGRHFIEKKYDWKGISETLSGVWKKTDALL